VPPPPEVVVVGVALAPLLPLDVRVASSRARMPWIRPCSDDRPTDAPAGAPTRRQGSLDAGWVCNWQWYYQP
jgi:hypothetical protein